MVIQQKKIAKNQFLYFGKKVCIYSTAKIVSPENLFLDDHSIISDFCFILATGFTKIGKYSRLAPYSSITGGGQVYIGDFTDISYGVKIISGSDDILGPYLFSPTVPKEDRNIIRDQIQISNYSFIGSNSIIYPGVKIGEGVVVNPGTIVKNDLEPWSIYGEASCHLLGKRKHRQIILEKSEKLFSKKLDIE